MTKVKVFVYGRRRRRQRRRRRGYDNSSPDFRHGELKIRWKCTDYKVMLHSFFTAVQNGDVSWTGMWRHLHFY